MAEPVFYGICSNCLHARICRFSLNAARPVHFCDLYEVNGRTARSGPETTSGSAAVPNSDSENDGFKGLCVDCEKRYRCEKAATESGVWRCRDYQGEPPSLR